MNQVRIEGQSGSDTGTGKDFKNEIAISTRSVSQDYFDALGLGLVIGRGFSANEHGLIRLAGLEAIKSGKVVCQRVRKHCRDALPCAPNRSRRTPSR